MIKKKIMKYGIIVAAVSCCLLFADKNISFANADKDTEGSTIYSASETNGDLSPVYKNINDSDKADNGYPKAKYRYEVNDNGDITLLPFLQYAYVSEDGNITWSAPVKDIDNVKEYFNEEMLALMQDRDKHKTDTIMSQE